MSIALLHVEFQDRTQNSVELRFWSENPNQAISKTQPLGALEPYLNRSDDDFYLFPGGRSEDLGKVLYRWLEGSDGLIGRALGLLESSSQIGSARIN